MQTYDPCREIRFALTGLSAEAADVKAAAFARWVALFERSGDTARADAAASRRAECERIAALTRTHGWDVYRPSLERTTK
jgi:hypothetical protein